MKTKSALILLITFSSTVLLLSCTSFKGQKKKMINEWTGFAEISFDSNYIPNSNSFPFSDSLVTFYKSSDSNNYINISLNDSFAVIDGLYFYQNRAFVVDWTPLKAGKEYIVLWTYSTREDLELREALKRKASNPQDSLSGNSYCLEMFDVTKDREIIFLKDIDFKGDSMFCQVESDLVMSVKQHLALKKLKP